MTRSDSSKPKNLSLFDLPALYNESFNGQTRNVHPDQIQTLDQLKSPKDVFKRLSDRDWNFTESNTTYLSHNIHPYPAKFIPQIPYSIIVQLSRPGELVWDPFGGSGTTALEAILNGRRALSTDCNPLGAVIGEAKTVTLTHEEEVELIEWGESLEFLSRDLKVYNRVIEESESEWRRLIPDIPNISHWFHSDSTKELAHLRLLIDRLSDENQKSVARVAYSRTVSKVSYQDSETRYARREKDIKFGTTVKRFSRELKFCLKSTRELGRLLGFRKANFETLDLRKPIVGVPKDGEKEPLIRNNSVDLIVTSPPYPNATDYHLYHRFRLFWLGYDPRPLARIEIGSHLRHQKEGTGFENYLAEMELCLKNMLLALRPGRYSVLVLGDGVFKGVTYSTAEEVEKAAADLGFEVVGRLNRSIHATRRSFMVSARRARQEQILVLRKPLAPVCYKLYPPNYKLWDYEADLRRREVVSLLGHSPETCDSNVWNVEADALAADKLRMLTFTHSFSGDYFAQERTWQSRLENGVVLGNSARKESRYITHGVHPYKGKFYPQLARSLFNISGLLEGQKVLDPFCGSGTLVLEGYLNGLRSYGCDLSPLAVKIARAKTQIIGLDPFERDRMLSQVLSELRRLNPANDYYIWFDRYTESAREEIERWFPVKVLEKIAHIFRVIRNVSHPIMVEFLEVVLSSIVRQISQQDPRDLRIRRRKRPIADAPAIQLFSDAVATQREKLLRFEQVRNFAPASMGTAEVWEGDTRDINCFTGRGVETASIDAVITSPPYATALPYVDTDRLSFLLLFGMSSSYRRPLETNLIGTREISKRDRKHHDDLIENNDFGFIKSKVAQEIITDIYVANRQADVGFRRKNRATLLYKYFADMTRALSNIDKLLKKNGQAFFILGNNSTKAGGELKTIDTIEVTKDMGRTQGWELVDEIPISVTRENYKHVRHTITKNSILWFRKSG